MNYLRYHNYYHHHFDSARRSFVSPVKLMFCGLSGATRALYPPTAVCLPHSGTSVSRNIHASFVRSATVTYALRLNPSATLNSHQINWRFEFGGGGVGGGREVNIIHLYSAVMYFMVVVPNSSTNLEHETVEIMFQSVLHFSPYPKKKKSLNWPLDSSTAQCMHTVTASNLVNSALSPELLNSLLGYSIPHPGLHYINNGLQWHKCEQV